MSTIAERPQGNASPQTLENTPPKILCVDDDPNFIAAMQRNFHAYNADFQSAFHGMQGVMEAVETRPDVILTDLQMPLASGEEMIDFINSNPTTVATPIVVLTGRADAKLTARFRSKGVVAVLPKPLKFERLVEELQKIIPLGLK